MSNIFDVFLKISQPKIDITHIVVGLGNYGVKYENTRHNAGFMALNLLAEKYNTKISKFKFQSLISEVTIDNKRVLLLKPQTYMNLSGIAVAQAMAYYKIPIENVIVVYDDISMAIGRIRIRRNGTAGGHNGIKSIIDYTNSKEFPRVKIGIGNKPNENWDLADWVLSKFNNQELKELKPALEKSLNAIELIILNKAQEAMNNYN